MAKIKNKKINFCLVILAVIAAITIITTGPAAAWGKSINVAVVDDYYSPSMGYVYPADYPNQTFSVLTPYNLSASTLVNKDTLFLWAFNPSLLSSSQKSAINAWIYSGGKLIIWDSEEPYGVAGGWDYTWLAYPFSTSVPGAMGAYGQGFWVAEENTLSSGNPASPYYIDTDYLNNYTDAIGDSNVFTSYSTNWCVDMKARNTLGVEGPNHLYARYGNGLIIYSGLDWDPAGYSLGWDPISYKGAYNLKKLFKQELEVSGNLPCGIVQTGTPSLRVTKSADKTSANIGDKVNFTITVTNIGNNTAYNVNMTDILPAELNAVSATAINLGNIAAGTSQTMTVTATVASAPLQTTVVKNIANAAGRDSQQNIVAGSGNVSLTIIGAGGAGGTVVSIADVTMTQNSNVTRPIMIENVNNLAAATIWLTYDTNVVQVLSVSAGDLGGITPNIDNIAGKTTMSAFSIAPKNGNVIFANVMLRSVGNVGGTSPLNLSVQTLADQNGAAIPHTLRNGMLTISAVIKGDTSGDGIINIVDALFIAQYTVGLRTFTAAQLAAGDVNGDGMVNIVDALFLAQATVGLRIL